MSTTRQSLGRPAGYRPSPPSSSPPGWAWVKMTVRVAGPALVVGALLVIKPEIITGTLETTGAMLRVGALLLGWLVFSFLVRRFARPPVLRTGLIAVVGLALLAVTVRPYFIDTRADDTLLTAPASASISGTPDAAGVPSVSGASGVPSSPRASTAPGAPSTAGAPDAPSKADAPSIPGGEMAQRMAVKVSSGQLRGLAGHRGAGTASIVRTPEGSHVVQLEDYNVSSGITLYLYVVPGANQKEPGANSVNLGRLAENTGNRVVPIPSGTDLSGLQTVLIWCEPFTTPIAAANQIPT